MTDDNWERKGAQEGTEKKGLLGVFILLSNRGGPLHGN